MPINKLVRVTYDDFKLRQVIDPDKFDQNNIDLVGKIDELVEGHNTQETHVATAIEKADSVLGIAERAESKSTIAKNQSDGAVIVSNEAKAIANEAKAIANTATNAANTAAENADEKAALAANASRNATDAATLAVDKAGLASQNALLAEQKAALANTAAGNAVLATDAANTAANAANTAADLANGKATQAEQTNIAIVGAEALRVTAEQSRVNAEGDATKGRVKAENERATAEQSRVDAEGDATKGRVKAENDRATAEQSRATTFAGYDGRITGVETQLAGISTGANKVETSVTNGNIKIDGVEKTVYTHPDNHDDRYYTEDEIDAHLADFATHLASEMPHQIKDLQANKIFRIGIQLSTDGSPQLIFKEVE